MRRKFSKNQKVSKYFDHDDDHDDDHDVEHFKNYHQKQSFANVLQKGILKRFSIFTRSAGKGADHYYSSLPLPPVHEDSCIYLQFESEMITLYF